jgi:hypothetical protein
MVMTFRNKDVAPSRARVLNDVLLTRAHELNRDYVELLVTQSQARHDVEGLPLRLLYELAALSATARVRFAAAPFMLYSLGFEDQHLWRAILEDERVAAPQDRYVVSSAPSATAFCEVALFFAWHTAVLNRFAARMLFSMPDAIVERIVQTPLWRLRRIAAEFPGLLLPRWPSNPAFWPDLLRFAAAGDWQRLEMTQLLGSQLIAAELDAAAEEEENGMRSRNRRAELARMRRPG